MSLKEIESEEEFNREIKGKDRDKGSRTALVDFYANWCRPCQVIRPVVEKFSEKPEFKEIRFFRVNIDDDKFEGLGTEYRIHAIPTFIMFQDGVEMENKKVVGADSRALERMLAQVAGDIEADRKVAGPQEKAGNNPVEPAAQSTKSVPTSDSCPIP